MPTAQSAAVKMPGRSGGGGVGGGAGSNTLFLSHYVLYVVPPSMTAIHAVEVQRHSLLRVCREENCLVVIALWAPDVFRSGKSGVSSHVLQHDRFILFTMFHFVYIYTVVLWLCGLCIITVLAIKNEAAVFLIFARIQQIVCFRTKL